MKKINTIVDIYNASDEPDDWVVQALDPDDDGGISTTIFSGSYAESRAKEYAELKYAGFQRHAPYRQRYQYYQ